MRNMTRQRSTDSVAQATARHRLTVLVIGGMAASLLLVGCGSQRAGSSGDLPVLHIGDERAPAKEMSDSVASAAGGMAINQQGEWIVEGTLPDGPSTGPVLRYDTTKQIESAQVATLAKSLGLKGDPVRHDHGWAVEETTGTLHVRDGGEWTFTRGKLSCSGWTIDIDTVDSMGSGVACSGSGVATAVATDGSGTTSSGTTSSGTTSAGSETVATPPTVIATAIPVPTANVPTIDSPPPAPDATSSPGDPGSVTPQPIDVPPTPIQLPPAIPAADALAAAAPVITAAGVEGTPRIAPWGGSPTSVLVDPVISGLPTAGVRTVIDVDVEGVLDAYGRLGLPAEIAQYPVISAQAALKQLTVILPMMDMACPVQVAPSGSTETPVPACPTPPPSVIVSAEFGLRFAFDGSDPVLVPAWLFMQKDGYGEAIAADALEPQYIAQPSPIPIDGIGGIGGSAGSGVASANPGPAVGAPVPMPPAGTVAGAPIPVYIESYTPSADGRMITLHAYAGVCAEYSADFKEDSDHVYAFITGTVTIGKDQACIELAKKYDFTIELAQPLGKRTVVDAATNSLHEVPVS